MEKQEIVELLTNDFDSDIRDNETIVSDHESECGIERGSDFRREQLPVASEQSKNRYKWCKEPSSDSRTRRHNMLRRLHLPRLTGQARSIAINARADFWNVLTDNDFLELIVTWTNEKITELSSKYCGICSFANHTDHFEIRSLIDLLHLTGVIKSGHEDVKGLWNSDGTGRDIFRATMPLQRFLFFLVALRFDDPSQRAE
ncbi:hypothetical protein PR048_020378 [Dryococelus australis]|uniref:PiggyBac transposable element-derived protein domain-containing protein n=1 Tax=Dryococelus australis TaxID=614101 RepID=A0ABQ9H643_9NEOP|nr:hypothetical protein PR048_020378 [Dryococelus australis]